MRPTVTMLLAACLAAPAIGPAAMAQTPTHGAGPAAATSPPGTMPMPMPMPAPGTVASTSTREYQQAMERMHQDMAITYSGDPDRDFVAAMIPHHQGAVDMAEVEMRYGHDPAMKALAHSIAVDQRREIIEMRNWQAQHAGLHPPAAASH
jgi:hypothetical protein